MGEDVAQKTPSVLKYFNDIFKGCVLNLSWFNTVLIQIYIGISLFWTCTVPGTGRFSETRGTAVKVNNTNLILTVFMQSDPEHCLAPRFCHLTQLCLDSVLG